MLQRIVLSKEDMKFSIAHFTIFSKEKRERLHGHNYQLKVFIDLKNIENGMAFDYREVKVSIRSLCKRLDERFAVQELSPYLKITKNKEMISLKFAGEKMSFPADDVLLLPIENTTLECLGDYVIDQLLAGMSTGVRANISALGIKLSSGPGQTLVKKISTV